MEYELEKIRQAKMYIDYLVNGIDPISNTDADSETFHKEEVIACFRYISDVLSEKMENSMRDRGRENFYITEEQILNMKLFPFNCKVSELAGVINKVAKENGTRKIPAAKINDWLEFKGYLYKSEFRGRVPTEKGKQLGITTEYRKLEDGREYYINLYSEQTQKYIIEHITDISVFKKNNSSIVQVPSIEFPSHMSINEFVRLNKEKCFIISIGSCDLFSNIGSYFTVLLFKNKSKVIQKTGIHTNSVNKCILNGIIDAVSVIKIPTEIIILSSTPLGFNTAKSKNYSLCQEICEILAEKECNFSVSVCQGKGNELNNFVKSLAKNSKI